MPNHLLGAPTAGTSFGRKSKDLKPEINDFVQRSIEHPVPSLSIATARSILVRHPELVGQGAGLRARQMPSLHEFRALFFRLYAFAAGRWRPFRVPKDDNVVREERSVYRPSASPERQKMAPVNFLTENRIAA